MDSREDLPRVSVGNVVDWQRVKVHYKSAVLASLEENVSLDLSGERDALVMAINQFIDHAIRMAQSNLRVNGQNYETLDQDEQNTEAFDEALDRRIWSLADTRLQWQKRIAETRRTKPHETATIIYGLCNQQRNIDQEEAVAGREETITEDVVSEDLDVFPRYFDMEEGLKKTVALGEELDQTMTSQKERAAEIRTVTGEVKTLRAG